MSAPMTTALDTVALYHQRRLPPPPFPAYRTSKSSSGSAAAGPPIKILRGGHRPAPASIGTVSEPLSSNTASVKGICSVRALGWSIDGRRLASSSSDRSIRIWTPELSIDARATSELRGHTDGVEQIAWDPTHPERLASASGDRTVRLWDIRTAKETHNIPTPGANINIAYHPKGTHIAVGDRSDNVSLIDVRAGKTLGLIRSQGAPPVINSAGSSSTVSWTASEREEINEFTWTPDGRHFVLGTGGGSVRVLDARSLDVLSAGEPSSGEALLWPLIHTIVGHTATVFCTCVDPLGRYLATASADSTTALWTMDEWFNVAMTGHLTYPPRSISFSFDGEFLAAGGEDNFISITAVAPMDPVSVDSPLCKIPVDSAVNGLAWHPKKMFLAYAGDGREGTIRIWGMP